MKTLTSFLKTIALTLPLALLAQSSVPAQDNGATRTPPTVTSGRQAVMEKLDHIRLAETPKAWESMPLVEVVRGLRDEARARDPDKKGINFLFATPRVTAPAIDPNTGLPIGTGQTESAYLTVVNVRITSPLRDVRLVDVLDAITKTADHPIKYSIEDYGVVFDFKEPEDQAKEEPPFTFPGGTPRRFMEAVEKQFKVDWLSIASIPAEMQQVQIPKLRLTPKPKGNVALGMDSPVRQLVLLYNSLAEKSPQLGTLIVDGDDPRKPSAVMLVPNKTTSVVQARMKTKAFPLRGISEKDWATLADEIMQMDGKATQYEAKMTGGLEAWRPGIVKLHQAAALLVVTGSESFVEMAESVVAAFQANQQAKETKVSTEKK